MSVYTKFSVDTGKNPSPVVQKAAEVFCEEIKKRTGLSPVEGGAEIAFTFTAGQGFAPGDPALSQALAALDAPGAEGYRIAVAGGQVLAVGHDPRGAFYAMGRILRGMVMEEGSFTLCEGFGSVSQTPDFEIRGHQLGNRSKNNTYDAWSLAQYDQYIRDLAIFGANTIEILPPRTDDDLYSPLFTMDPMEMMCRLSEIIHSYGLDVSLWYPNMGRDYDDPAVREAEYAEREEVFSKIPYLDQVMVPGGDPGDLEPDVLFPLTGEYAALCSKYHQHVKFWLSPQAFEPSQRWMDAFYRQAAKKPAWLAGVCFAPWERDDLPVLRKNIPADMKIRNYPDVSHTIQCQFPAADMCTPFRLVYGREAPNPRPNAYQFLHNRSEGDTVGAVTYSEGIHDDVNKIVWAWQDFCCGSPVRETIEEYCRLFIDGALAAELAGGIMMLEKNWGVPAGDPQIAATYAHWQSIAEKRPALLRDNYRFQMCYLRACTDAYTQKRYAYEQAIEGKALAILEAGYRDDCGKAMEQCWFAYDEKVRRPVDPALHDQIHQLADDLLRTIGLQLTVTHHRGQDYNRGAWIEVLDFPLNNQQYFTKSFERIFGLPTEQERQDAVYALLHRTDPGEGGFYRSFSMESKEGVEIAHQWEDDPSFLGTVCFDIDVHRMFRYFTMMRGTHKEIPLPLEWITNVKSFYGTPIRVSFDGLDPSASYRVRTAYTGAYGPVKIRLTAGDEEIHGPIPAPQQGDFPCYASSYNEINLRACRDLQFTFSIPKSAYRDGKLTLCFTPADGYSRIDLCELFILKD